MNPSFPDTAQLQEKWQTQKGSDIFNPNALQIDIAKEFMRSYTHDFRIKLGDEVIPLEASLGRILASPIIANMNVPSANNSAMDGYAFSSIILSHPSPIQLTVIGKQMAGQAPQQDLLDQFDPHLHCVRIMTGAVMPVCCDTVIPQEWVSVKPQGITFDPAKIAEGENLRLQGEDIRLGDEVLPAGRILRPSDLGLIASMGFATVQVKQRITVAYFSTGDEVSPLGSEILEGALFDSNRYTLLGMLTQLGVQLIDLGIVRDDPVALREVFSAAANQADAIITSGGVSVGEADFTKSIMQDLGDVAFWTLAIKPGRPMAFGKINTTDSSAVLFGLPGNPVAVMVTFYQFVQDILLYMSGANHTPLVFRAKFDGTFTKKPGRTEFIRGILYRDGSGDLWVKPHGHQGSGILRSMSEADCLVTLLASQSHIIHGDLVDISAINCLI
jgi:molybdopterin molybdotransferase